MPAGYKWLRIFLAGRRNYEGGWIPLGLGSSREEEEEEESERDTREDEIELRRVSSRIKVSPRR